MWQLLHEGYMDKSYGQLMQVQCKTVGKRPCVIVLHELPSSFAGGEVMNVLFAALIGGFAVGQAAPNLKYFQRGKASGAAVFRIIARKPVIGDATVQQMPAACEGNVELRNVHFAYPARPENPVFRDFCLQVPSGKTVALVGESGSGKSTVVGLIERFYDPQQGQVSVAYTVIAAAEGASVAQLLSTASDFIRALCAAYCSTL